MARYQVEITEVKSGGGCGTLIFIVLIIIGIAMLASK